MDKIYYTVMKNNRYRVSLFETDPDKYTLYMVEVKKHKTLGILAGKMLTSDINIAHDFCDFLNAEARLVESTNKYTVKEIRK